MAETTGGERRPGGAGSIQWRGGRPYAVCRDALTGKQTWTGFDTEEQADAFLTQWAADRKAARVAAKASRPERTARAPQRRARSSSDPWTFGQLLTDLGGPPPRWCSGVDDARLRPQPQRPSQGARGCACPVADRRALRGLQAREARRNRRRRGRGARTQAVGGDGQQAPRARPPSHRRGGPARGDGRAEPGRGGRAPARPQARADG